MRKQIRKYSTEFQWVESWQDECSWAEHINYVNWTVWHCGRNFAGSMTTTMTRN